jgi:two-component system sensor histidine kinase YesM
VYVKGTLDGNSVVITVEDDGIGMTEQRRNELNEQLKNEYQLDGEHVGIFNVNQRIKLLYGDEYGIIINNRENGGLVVSVMFPQDKIYGD